MENKRQKNKKSLDFSFNYPTEESNKTSDTSTNDDEENKYQLTEYKKNNQLGKSSKNYFYETKLPNKALSSNFDDILNITSEIKNRTPKFLLNLYRILSFNSSSAIKWNDEGNGLIITNRKDFMAEIGPFLTKSKDISGFLRQLSNYGFSKEKTFLHNTERDEYASKYFIYGRPDLLKFCARPSPQPHYKSDSGEKNKPTSIRNNLTNLSTNINTNVQTGILNKLGDLEENNFDLQKKIMELENKVRSQDDLLKKMTEFLSKLYLKKYNFDKKNDVQNANNEIQKLMENFPLTHRFNLKSLPDKKDDEIKNKDDNERNTKDEDFFLNV